MVPRHAVRNTLGSENAVLNIPSSSRDRKPRKMVIGWTMRRTRWLTLDSARVIGPRRDRLLSAALHGLQLPDGNGAASGRSPVAERLLLLVHPADACASGPDV